MHSGPSEDELNQTKQYQTIVSCSNQGGYEGMDNFIKVRREARSEFGDGDVCETLMLTRI